MTNQRTVVAAPTEATIAFSREFEAEAAMVFEAYTDADQLARWVGPRGTTMRLREFDARTGGAWSYVIEGAGGSWAFHGTFHDVTAPRRIVQTFEYEGNPEHPNLDILTFSDLPGGRSRIDGLSVYPSVEARDSMLDVDSGMDEDFERLDEHLASRVGATA
jgi:uncharacterized protein YndB with AHSA1/START domain